MRIFTMTDLEGVSGVIGRSDGIGNRIENIDQARRLLTAEVNATVEGLARGGADEIVVADGHGGSNSILIEDLDRRASLLRVGGDLFPPAWSLESGYDAALQLGAHAMMGVRDGFLHHSFNSHGVARMTLNGSDIGEIGIIALMAGYFETPTILVSGDRAACREAGDFLGAVETVETKAGLTRYTSIDRNPLLVREELAATAEGAIRGFGDVSPKVLDPPYELRVQLMCPNLADGYEKRGVQRIDYLTVAVKSEDFMDLWAQRVGWAAGLYADHARRNDSAQASGVRAWR